MYETLFFQKEKSRNIYPWLSNNSNNLLIDCQIFRNDCEVVLISKLQSLRFQDCNFDSCDCKSARCSLVPCFNPQLKENKFFGHFIYFFTMIKLFSLLIPCSLYGIFQIFFRMNNWTSCHSYMNLNNILSVASVTPWNSVSFLQQWVRFYFRKFFINSLKSLPSSESLRIFLKQHSMIRQYYTMPKTWCLHNQYIFHNKKVSQAVALRLVSFQLIFISFIQISSIKCSACFYICLKKIKVLLIFFSVLFLCLDRLNHSDWVWLPVSMVKLKFQVCCSLFKGGVLQSILKDV